MHRALASRHADSLQAEQINGCKEQETNCSLTLVERKNIGFEVVSVCDGGADTSS